MRQLRLPERARRRVLRRLRHLPRLERRARCDRERDPAAGSASRATGPRAAAPSRPPPPPPALRRRSRGRTTAPTRRPHRRRLLRLPAADGPTTSRTAGIPGDATAGDGWPTLPQLRPGQSTRTVLLPAVRPAPGPRGGHHGRCASSGTRRPRPRAAASSGGGGKRFAIAGIAAVFIAAVAGAASS